MALLELLLLAQVDGTADALRGFVYAKMSFDNDTAKITSQTILGGGSFSNSGGTTYFTMPAGGTWRGYFSVTSGAKVSGPQEISGGSKTTLSSGNFNHSVTVLFIRVS